jgi:tRNA1Val (adenine37-N6)-methyltransferase
MANSYFTFKEFTIYQDRCSFKVGTDGVLLGAVADAADRGKILDIGTGTGLIAIMLAQRSNADIVAIEPDRESFLQANHNISLCKWSNRIKIEQTDLQGFNMDGSKFDLIVTNPPFFNDSLRNPDTRKSSARHNDSLTTHELLENVSRLLDTEGVFQLILPYVEGNIFIAEASLYGFYCNSILKIRPLPTSDIRRMILSFSRTRQMPSEKFLTIERGKRYEFTEEYTSLTKDFYLKF